MAQKRNGSIIQLSDLRIKDTGKYTCSATNGIAGVFSSKSLKITVGKRARYFEIA